MYLEISRNHLRECFDHVLLETLWALCTFVKACALAQRIELLSLYIGYADTIYVELEEQGYYTVDAQAALDHVHSLIDEQIMSKFRQDSDERFVICPGALPRNLHAVGRKLNPVLIPVPLQVTFGALRVLLEAQCMQRDPTLASKERLNALVHQTLCVRNLQLLDLNPIANCVTLFVLIFAYARLERWEDFGNALMWKYSLCRDNMYLSLTYGKLYVVVRLLDMIALVKPKYRDRVDGLKRCLPPELEPAWDVDHDIIDDVYMRVQLHLQESSLTS
jgi:hypothetical protein